MELNELSAKAAGGTELMAKRLHDSLPAEMVDEFQIIMSRVRNLDESKYRILWLHDLADDGENAHLANGGWAKFHALVFVSYFQMNEYIKKFNIPYRKCCVIQNAIEPIPEHDKPKGTLNLIYFSTPHRGLNILIPVFEKLVNEGYDIHLNVFSSFKVYGWPNNDKPFEDLFERCRKHPNITYHGAVPNDVIREELKKSHILAFPSTWPETSCLVLIESMSAGLVCVHSDLAALPETSGGFTTMYHYDEELPYHASSFYAALKYAIEKYDTEDVRSQVQFQRAYVNVRHRWSNRADEWKHLLMSIIDAKPPKELPAQSGPSWSYNTSAK